MVQFIQCDYKQGYKKGCLCECAIFWERLDSNKSNNKYYYLPWLY